MNLENFYLNRAILELKYNEGFLYWDNCGATILEIKKNHPDWQWNRTSTELSVFRNIKRKMELVFNIHHIRFIQDEVENLNQFKKAVSKIAPIITQKLKIEKFSRVGNRFLYIYPLENTDKGKEIIKKIEVFDIQPDKVNIFGENPKKTGFIFYIQDDITQYRVEITTIERVDQFGAGKLNEKFHPKYGLRVDIDIAVIDEVSTLDFSLDDFIQHNSKFIENNFSKLF